MHTRPNDLYLFGPYPPPYGGVSIYVDQLSRVLKQRNIAYTLKWYHTTSGVKGEVIPTFSSILRHFWSMSHKTICLDSSSFFIEYPSRRVLMAWLILKKIRRFRWIKIIHDGTLSARFQAFPPETAALCVRAIRHVDEFVVVSDEIEDWLRNEIKVQQSVHQISSLLPLSSNYHLDLPPVIESVRNKYDKIVCSVGVFDPKYGFAHVVNAVECLRNESDVNVGLLLIDGGFTRDDNYKSALLQNRAWVTVLDEVPHPQLLSLLAVSDVFVRGVERESVGISKIEALWAQTPVVSTRTGETRGMLLYDYGDEAQLVHQIRVALFEKPTEEISKWSALFQANAEDNLERLLKVIGH